MILYSAWQESIYPVSWLPHCVLEEIFLSVGATLYIYPYADMTVSKFEI